MSELMNIIKSRRSTRAFKPELPPVEQIRRIVEAAEWAPSGMGRYNWHFSVVYNPEKTLKLARAIAEADNRGPEYNFYGAPVIINISCERDDRNALLNGAAAIETLMLAATDLGLGSCWINQLRETCDVLASVPISRSVESLNAAVATGISLYEVDRLRRRAADNGS